MTELDKIIEETMLFQETLEKMRDSRTLFEMSKLKKITYEELKEQVLKTQPLKLDSEDFKI